MGMTFIRKLPDPAELKQAYPLSPELTARKQQRDNEIRRVFTGEDDRFIVIIGPCSADNEDSVCDYMDRLAKINDQVKDRLLLIPRIYTNKPRTTGEGYKGMLHQPDPEKAPDMYEGLASIRRMHIRVIRETGFTAADEMLYPENRSYLDDLLSYEAVGARSVENQQHRLVASGIDIPVGMKNPTSGDFAVMINSVFAAQHSHTFIYNGASYMTSGNPLTHCILRGGVDKYGKSFSNYHYEELMRVQELYASKSLVNPAIIVDANHSNSGKQFKQQIRITKEVLHSRRQDESLKQLVKGMMIESYIEEGSQPISENRIYGKSITDPCLGWADTEKLLYEMAYLC